MEKALAALVKNRTFVIAGRLEFKTKGSNAQRWVQFKLIVGREPAGWPQDDTELAAFTGWLGSDRSNPLPPGVLPELPRLQELRQAFLHQPPSPPAPHMPQLLHTLGHDNSVWSVAFSADGATLATGSTDNTAKLWDAQTGKLLHTLTGHDQPVQSVAFSADGATLATGSEDNTAKLWDAQTGKLLHTLRHDQWVLSVAFSTDGATLATGSLDKTAKLWDAQTGKLLHTLTGHDQSVWSVAFSPDGATLATGSFDNTAKLWDAKTGELLHTLTGHDQPVQSVAFSADGATLATGSGDNTAKLWDAKTGELLHTLPGHDQSVRSVAFSPDGATLATGGDDNTAKLWRLPAGPEKQAGLEESLDPQVRALLLDFEKQPDTRAGLSLLGQRLRTLQPTHRLMMLRALPFLSGQDQVSRLASAVFAGNSGAARQVRSPLMEAIRDEGDVGDLAALGILLRGLALEDSQAAGLQVRRMVLGATGYRPGWGRIGGQVGVMIAQAAYYSTIRGFLEQVRSPNPQDPKVHPRPLPAIELYTLVLKTHEFLGKGFSDLESSPGLFVGGNEMIERAFAALYEAIVIAQRGPTAGEAQILQGEPPHAVYRYLNEALRQWAADWGQDPSVRLMEFNSRVEMELAYADFLRFAAQPGHISHYQNAQRLRKERVDFVAQRRQALGLAPKTAGLEEQGKPEEDKAPRMRVTRRVAPLEQRVEKAREMLTAPVKRGSKWMRVAAGMRKAWEFHWRWRRTTEKTVSADFAGRAFVFDLDALWKAADWFRGSDALVEALGGPMEEPFSAQYERRGRFVAEERDGIVRVTGFIPSPSYAVDPMLTGYGPEVEAAQQGTLPLGVLIDREVERELGISDELYQIPEPPDVLLINAHSHPSWSRYPDGPSEGDQKLKMPHGAELVYGIRNDVWSLFNQDATLRIAVPPAAGLEENLREHVAELNRMIDERRWSGAAAMSAQVIKLTMQVLPAEIGRNSEALRELGQAVQRVQALTAEQRPQDAEADRALRRWEANSIGLLSAASFGSERFLSEATASHFLTDAKSLEGHLWFLLDSLWGAFIRQGRAAQVGLKDLPGLEVQPQQAGEEWAFWLDALQVLLWTTPREQFDATQVNLVPLLEEVPAETLPPLIARWDPQGHAPSSSTVAAIFPGLTQRMGRVPLHVRLAFLLRQDAPVANLSGVFHGLVSTLADRVGSPRAAEFMSRQAVERYNVISRAIDPQYQVWRPSFSAGLEEQALKEVYRWLSLIAFKMPMVGQVDVEPLLTGGVPERYFRDRSLAAEDLDRAVSILEAAYEEVSTDAAEADPLDAYQVVAAVEQKLRTLYGPEEPAFEFEGDIPTMAEFQEWEKTPEYRAYQDFFGGVRSFTWDELKQADKYFAGWKQDQNVQFKLHLSHFSPAARQKVPHHLLLDMPDPVKVEEEQKDEPFWMFNDPPAKNTFYRLKAVYGGKPKQPIWVYTNTRPGDSEGWVQIFVVDERLFAQYQRYAPGEHTKGTTVEPLQGESILQTMARNGMISLLPGAESADFVREAEELLKEQEPLFRKKGKIPQETFDTLWEKLDQLAARFFAEPTVLSVALQLHFEQGWMDWEWNDQEGKSEFRGYKPKHYRDVGNKMLAELRSLKELIRAPPPGDVPPTQAGLEELGPQQGESMLQTLMRKGMISLLPGAESADFVREAEELLKEQGALFEKAGTIPEPMLENLQRRLVEISTRYFSDPGPVSVALQSHPEPDWINLLGRVEKARHFDDAIAPMRALAAYEPAQYRDVGNKMLAELRSLRNLIASPPAAGPAPTQAGLEEAWALLASGRALTDLERPMVQRVVEDLFGEKMAAEPTEVLRQRLDPEGTLSAAGKKIWVLRGFSTRIRAILEQAGLPSGEVVLTFSAPVQANGGRADLYLDALEALRLSNSGETVRGQWLQQTTARVTPPAAGTAALQPLTQAAGELLASLSPTQPERMLPMMVQQAIVITQLVVPEDEKKYMLTLVQEGKRTPGELTLAVQMAGELQVTPGQVLGTAARNALTVPMAGDLIELAQGTESTVGFLGKWLKQIHAVERGEGPKDVETIEAWKQAPPEVKEETLEVLTELTELWKGLQDSHDGASQISFAKVLELYNLIRSADETKEALRGLFEYELSRKELYRRFPYRNRLMDLMERIRFARSYSSDFLDMFKPGPEDYGGEDDFNVEESWAGLEEAAPRSLSSLGAALTPEQHQVVQEALERLMVEGIGGPDGSAHAFLVAEKVRRIDADGLLEKSRMRPARADFLNEWIRKVAGELGVPFPPDFIFSYPWKKTVTISDNNFKVIGEKEEPTFFLDTATIRMLEALPEEERRVFVRQLVAQPAGDPPWSGPAARTVLDSVHQKAGRALAHSIPGDLGWNVRRKEAAAGEVAQPTQPEVLQHVWGGERFYERRDVNKAVDAFAQKWSLPGREALTKRIRAVLKALAAHLGPPGSYAVGLGARLGRPLLFEKGLLIIDATVLALPPKEIQALTEYGAGHFNRANSVLLEEATARELVAYFEEALELVKEDGRLEALLSALQDLAQQGWDTQPHVKFLEAVRRSRENEDVRKALDLTGLPKAEWRVKRSRLMSAMKGQLTGRGGTLLPEKIVQAAFGQLPEKRTMRVLALRRFLVPTVQKVVRLMALRPGLSFAQAREILGVNSGLLFAVRLYGWEDLAMQLSFWSVPEVLADLRKGTSSWIYCAVSGDWPRGLEQDDKQSWVFVAYRDAVQGLAVLEGAGEGEGSLRQKNAFPSLRREEWMFFLAQIRGWLWQRATGTVRLVAQAAGKDTRGLRAPWEVFLDTAREQQWRDGLQMIRAGGDPAGLLDLLLEIRSARISDAKRAVQMLGDSVTDRFEEFKHVLLEGLLRRWGLALGLSLRTGPQPDEMGLYFQSYGSALRTAVERSAPAALAEKGRSLEAVYLIAAQLKISLPDDLLEEARGLVEAAWPSLLAVGPYDPSEVLALERAAFRYLLSIRDGPTLELLTRELAQYVDSRKRFLPNTSTYARSLLLVAGGQRPAQEEAPPRAPAQPAAVASLARFYLREVLTKETPDLADRIADFRVILESYPPELRRGVFENLYKTPHELKAILQSARSPRLTTYLVQSAPPELVAEHLRSFTVKEAGDLLRGVDPRVIRSVTSEFQQGPRGPDVLARGVYEEFVVGFPERVEDYQTAESLPNYYAILGVSRSAPPKVVKKSFRQLARLYHPDRFLNEGREAEQNAERRFKLVMEAWQVLSDSEKQAAYKRQIPNKSHLYPSEPWYERIPPEIAKQIEELPVGTSAPEEAGLEEKEPTEQRMRENLKKLKSGRAGQREWVLKWLERWMQPEVHPEIVKQGGPLAEALILNLRFFTPKVRRRAGSLLLTAIQQRSFPAAVWGTIPSAVAALLAHPYSYVREDARTLLYHFPHRGYGPVQRPMISVVTPLLKHADEKRRLFAYGLYVALLNDSTADGALHQPGLEAAVQGLEDRSERVRAIAQKVVAIGLKKGWVPEEQLPVVLARSAANLKPGVDDSLREAAARTLVSLPAEVLTGEPTMRQVTQWLVEATAPAAGRSDKGRVAFLEALSVLAGAAIWPQVHQAAITPMLQLVASDPEPSVRQAAQGYLKGMIAGGMASQEVGTVISGGLTALNDPEPRVKRAAQRTLLTIAEAPTGREALLLSMPALIDLLNHRNEGTREVMRELLVALAAWEEFRQVLEERKIQPSDLGVRTDLNWSQMGPFISVWNHLIALEPFGQLTLGARAVLRRTLTAQAKVKTDRLLAEAKGLALHLHWLEALDIALGLPTAGAELHVPFETEAEHARLAAVAERMASDIGPHQLTPSQKVSETQVDLRLLAAYPTAFTRLVRLFLETPEMEPYFSWVGAHYSVGVDLGGDLAHLALAFFYGEMTYPWLPVPRGKAEVGRPGAYTYRGMTLDAVKGNVSDATQSNLHPGWPLVVLRAISLGGGQPMYQPQELFPQDVENYVWFAMAADSPARSPARIAYESFRVRWRGWLEGLGGLELSDLVSAAEQAVKRAHRARVNDMLDTASARIYEALYGVSPEQVGQQQQGQQVPPAENIARAQPRREELAQILRDSIEGIQEVAMPDPEVRRTLLAYRRAQSLKEMDQAYEHAVKALVKALWAEERPEPKKEERLLDLLSALDPAQADRIRSGLGSLAAKAARVATPLPSVELEAGLEEMPALISDLHIYSVRVRNVLHRADLVTTLELLATPREEVKALKGLGTSGLQELEEALGEYGLRFQNSEELSWLLGIPVDSPSSAHNVAHVVPQIASPDPLTSVLAMRQIRRWLPPGSPGITSAPRRLIPNLFQQLLSPNNGVSQSARRLLIRLAAYPQFQPSLRNLLGGLPWSLALWPDLADSIAAIANRQSPPQWPSAERVSPTSDLGQAATRLRAWLEEAARAPSLSIVGVSPERARQQEAALRALAPVLPESLRERLIIVTGNAAEADQWTERQLFASSELALVAERLAQRFGREGEGIPLYYHATEGEASAMRDALVIWDLERRFRLVLRGREVDLRAFLRELLANLQGVPLQELQGQRLFEQAVSDAELLVGA